MDIDELYRTPRFSGGTRNLLIIDFDRRLPLEIINQSKQKTFIQKSFSFESEIICRGLFELEMKIQLGSIELRHRKFKSKSISAYHAFSIELADRKSFKKISIMKVEYHLPFLYPFTEMGIRISIDQRLAFQQGEIPVRYSKAK